MMNLKKMPFSRMLEISNKANIFLYGLWSNKTSILFNENGCGSSILDNDNIALNLDNETDVSTEPETKKRLSPIIKSDFVRRIETISIDEFVAEKNISKIDFIKLDVEGAEVEALKGAMKTMLRDRPQMAVSIYHKPEHLYEIPLYLRDSLDNYTYRLEHYDYRWTGTVLYAIPEELECV